MGRRMRDVTLPWRGHTFNNRGSSYMIRNALLCTIATLTLAACGGGSSDSSTAATSSADTDTATPLVGPNVGMIDRSQGSDGSESAASVATVASNTAATAPASTTPASTGSGASVATVSKVTTPIKTVNGVATLDWMPPTENIDGSALTNLAGYTVYYGTNRSDLSQSVKVSNPGLASYTVTGLTSGTWYFAVTSYSAEGVESTRTTTVSTTI
jgi:hypothetical protein